MEKDNVSPFRFAIITDSHLYDIDNHSFDGQSADAADKVMKMNPLPDFVVYTGYIGIGYDRAQPNMLPPISPNIRKISDW
ncbi:MAG TPA: hypothetical protein VMV88_06200 [Gallionella sp.]|nr:hypothetical protein [Gallionella sp.]